MLVLAKKEKNMMSKKIRNKQLTLLEERYRLLGHLSDIANGKNPLGIDRLIGKSPDVVRALLGG